PSPSTAKRGPAPCRSPRRSSNFSASGWAIPGPSAPANRRCAALAPCWSMTDRSARATIWPSRPTENPFCQLRASRTARSSIRFRRRSSATSARSAATARRGRLWRRRVCSWKIRIRRASRSPNGSQATSAAAAPMARSHSPFSKPAARLKDNNVNDRALVFFALGFALLFSGMPAPARAQTVKLNIVSSGIGPTQIVPYIAYDAGIFARNGIEAAVIRTRADVAVMSMLAGEAPMLDVAGPLIIRSNLKGNDAVFIGAGAVALNYWLMSSKTVIREWPDTVKKYVESQVETVQLLKTNREAWIKVLGKYIKLDRDSLEEL